MSSKRVLILAILLVPSLSMQAQQARTVRDGVYTDAQAARGAAVYKEKCASCHGSALGHRRQDSGDDAGECDGDADARAGVRCVGVHAAVEQVSGGTRGALVRR